MKLKEIIEICMDAEIMYNDKLYHKYLVPSELLDHTVSSIEAVGGAYGSASLVIYII